MCDTAIKAQTKKWLHAVECMKKVKLSSCSDQLGKLAWLYVTGFAKRGLIRAIINI